MAKTVNARRHPGAGRQLVAPVLVVQAKRAIAELRSAEASLLKMHYLLFMRAWVLGGILSRLKDQIPRGSWQTWVCSNLRELGSTDGARTENASRFMRFYRQNPNPTVGNSRHQIFSVDSMRKLMWGYVPKKERLQLEGDEDIKPGAHHLTFVNQFSKYDRQLRNGRVDGFNVEIFRRETEQMLHRIADLGGHDWFRGLQLTS